MSNKYVSPSNLARYDSNIKNYIDNKTSNLENYDDTEIRGLISDLDENKVSKEEGKGLFSGSYNDLTDQPTIPSIEGLVSEETLNNTLADYAKTENLPDEYDDTELANRITANEEAIAKLNGSGDGSVTKTVDDALNEFATNISNDGVVNTYKELVDYAAEHTSDIAEIVADIETNTNAIGELDNKVDTLETNLGGHTVKSDVPANAKFTDTVYDDTNVLKLQNHNVTSEASDSITGFSLHIKSSDGINSYISLTDVSNDANKTILYPAETRTPELYTDKIHEKTSGKGVTVSSLFNANHINAVTAEIGGFDGDPTFYGAVTSNGGFVGDLEGTASKNLPLAGGAMDTNAEVSFSGDRGTTTIKGGIVESSGSVKALDILTTNIYGESGNSGDVIDVYATLLIPEASIATLTVIDPIEGDLNGNAATATKLGTSDVGTVTRPIYLKAGVPTYCTYTLGKSVPSNAVFTDTKNTAGSTNSTSKLFLVGATTQATNPQTYSNSNCYVSGNNLYSNGRKCITSYIDDNTIIQMSNSTDNSYIRPNSIDFLHYDEGYDMEVGAGIEYNRVYLSNDDGTTTIEYTPYGLDSTGSSYMINLYNDTRHFGMDYDSFYAQASDSTRFNLGISSSPWKQLYATTSTIATSDRNEKTDIKDLDNNLTKDFVMSLKPSSYKFINNDSNRTHYGMISQDVEESMNSLGMSSLDFAGFIKSPKLIKSEETGNFVEVEGEYTYGLRYEEFIAPMIKMIQMQQEEIDELKSVVEKLSNKQ